ncbi:MAG: Mut7-C RNAse domain-containing protein, partial [Geminicoccaceae bacterium]
MLTCDRRLVPHAGSSQRVMTLPGESIDAAAALLPEKLGTDWLHAPFTRCLMDNGPLRLARADELARLPENARRGAGP